jgi:hypothetical protein
LVLIFIKLYRSSSRSRAASCQRIAALCHSQMH